MFNKIIKEGGRDGKEIVVPQIMMNVNVLKQALAAKVQAFPAEPSDKVEESPAAVAPIDNKQLVSFTITINLPAQQAGMFLQPIAGLMAELAQGSRSTQESMQAVRNDADLPRESSSRQENRVQSKQSYPSRSSTGTAPMSPKQKNMILALVAKKKLTPDQVESLLMKQIGHARGSDLTKLEASSFINMLLAM